MRFFMRKFKRKGWMKVTGAQIQTECLLQQFGLVGIKEGQVLRIEEVKPLSVAALIGIKEGWRIASVSGETDVSPQLLANSFTDLVKSESVSIRLWIENNRGGLNEVVLPQPVSLPRSLNRFRQYVSSEIGLTVDICGLNGYRTVFVSRVCKGSRAELCGFHLFDRIIAINGNEIDLLLSFYQELKSGELSIELEALDGRRHTLELKVGMLVPLPGQLKREEAGCAGENMVSNRLRELDDGYVELRNLILPSSNGRATQIDHTLIRSNGIFVIETKLLTGSVTGHVSEENWIQAMPNGEERSLFNPIWQNNFHMWAVERLLQKKGFFITVYPIVVLLNCRTNVVAPVPVIGLDQLIDCIRSYREEVIPSEKVPAIVELIKQGQVTSFFPR